MSSKKTLSIEDFQKWGAQGGKKKGSSKARGDSEYYKNLAKKRKKNPVKSA
jgi:hypothetical protein